MRRTPRTAISKARTASFSPAWTSVAGVPDVLLRASYSKTTAVRSTLDDWYDVGYGIRRSRVRAPPPPATRGLLPYESNNFDLAAEWYYAEGELTSSPTGSRSTHELSDPDDNPGAAVRHHGPNAGALATKAIAELTAAVRLCRRRAYSRGSNRTRDHWARFLGSRRSSGIWDITAPSKRRTELKFTALILGASTCSATADSVSSKLVDSQRRCALGTRGDRSNCAAWFKPLVQLSSDSLRGGGSRPAWPTHIAAPSWLGLPAGPVAGADLHRGLRPVGYERELRHRQGICRCFSNAINLTGASQLNTVATPSSSSQRPKDSRATRSAFAWRSRGPVRPTLGGLAGQIFEQNRADAVRLGLRQLSEEDLHMRREVLERPCPRIGNTRYSKMAFQARPLNRRQNFLWSTAMQRLFDGRLEVIGHIAPQ